VTVSAEYATFRPTRVDVLAGDTVTWRNDSVRAHTVTAEDGSFDSGRLGAGSVFTHRFEAPGAVPYYCRLHTFGGEVDVYRLLLDPLGGATRPGQERFISGRAALPPGGAVMIQGDDGGGFQDLATATVDPAGRFSTTIRPSKRTSYRARAGDELSPPVVADVLDRTISLTAHGSRRVVIVGTVTPAAPGTRAVLQLRLRERFGWWTVAGGRVDRNSHVRFVLRRNVRTPARIALTLPDGATVTATSPSVLVGPRRGR
jgi:hypothetical protein